MLNNYQSPYMESYLQEGAAGHAYDEGISNPFELAIFDLEQQYLDEIYTAWLSAKRNPAYLDYAAGTGRILALFRERTSTKVAMDTCPAQLEHARAKVPDASFIVDNIATNPGCLTISFDLITCFRLFLNIENVNRLPILEALRRVLKDDGLLVIDNHMNRYSILGLTALFMRHVLGFKDKKLARPGEKAIIGTMSEKEIRRLLEAAGFEIKNVYRFMVLPGHKNYTILPSRWLIPLERHLTKIPGLNKIGKNQIFVCQKTAAT